MHQHAILFPNKFIWTTILLYLISFSASAQTYHVSKSGSDQAAGNKEAPFLTISKAAAVAEAGSTIIVHEGIYREYINPPRGGHSDSKRISYLAAAGEKVRIKGSELIRNWTQFHNTVWRAAIPNSFFGNYNPYTTLIGGDWFDDYGRDHHTGAVYMNGQGFFEVDQFEGVLHPEPWHLTDLGKQSRYTWYCEADKDSVYLYANFQGADPNKELVEINVRPACFYPSVPGINYITVSGFEMTQAATQWAPPTAEQQGLIGTHWSKGWIIENNRITYSRCSGITLGKDRASGQNVWSSNPEIDGATHYNQVIQQALQAPSNWNKSTIGGHIVRNNEIAHCEQTGICGSMGGAFSTIEGNYIHDIWEQRLFAGAELAGIKLHGPVDCLIKGNRIVNCPKGIWLDWMTQGTRVSGNLLYGSYTEDFFSEVNHGPYLVDNNLFLSNCVSILDGSGGGAYVHNIINSKLVIVQQSRETPWLEPHATQVWGHAISRNGDNRFFNNIFLSVADEITDTMQNPWWKHRGSSGLKVYEAYFPMYVNGNVYLADALPYPGEEKSLVRPGHNAALKIIEEGKSVYLELRLPADFKSFRNAIINSDLLGRAKVSDARFETFDASDWLINEDYFGNAREEKANTAGPVLNMKTGINTIKIW